MFSRVANEITNGKWSLKGLSRWWSSQSTYDKDCALMLAGLATVDVASVVFLSAWAFVPTILSSAVAAVKAPIFSKPIKASFYIMGIAGSFLHMLSGVGFESFDPSSYGRQEGKVRQAVDALPEWRLGQKFAFHSLTGAREAEITSIYNVKDYVHHDGKGGRSIRQRSTQQQVSPGTLANPEGDAENVAVGVALDLPYQSYWTGAMKSERVAIWSGRRPSGKCPECALR